MLSSINHHVAILHLRVHRHYVQCVTQGQGIPYESDSSEQQPWHVLSLRRTSWYDLMDVDQRIEVFQGLWRVFHYLMRENAA